LSSFSWLHDTSASFVIVGLSTVTTLAATERPLLSPTFEEGSSTSDAPHQTPRLFSMSSRSRATRTYALVLLVTFQSTRVFMSTRLANSRKLSARLNCPSWKLPFGSGYALTSARPIGWI
jgi:hypothetical protein